MRWILQLLFLSITLSSCIMYVYEETPEETVEEKTKDQIVQESISNYIDTLPTNTGEYIAYKFGPLYQIKAKEIKELEDLKEQRKNLPYLKQNYPNNLDSVIAATDTLIAQKERFIKRNNIHNEYEMNHLFTLIDSLDDITFFDIDFRLNYRAEVIDLTSNIRLPLTKRELDFIDAYVKGDYFIRSIGGELNLSANKRFYDYFYDEFERSSNKTADLKRILEIMEYAKKENDLDFIELIHHTVEDYSRSGAMLKYKPNEFSKPKEVYSTEEERKSILIKIEQLKKEGADEDSLEYYVEKFDKLPPNVFLGYSIYHSFKLGEGEETEVFTFYYELDPYFRVVYSKNVTNSETDYFKD